MLNTTMQSMKDGESESFISEEDSEYTLTYSINITEPSSNTTHQANGTKDEQNEQIYLALEDVES